MMFNYFFDVLLPIKMMFSTMNNVYPLSDVLTRRRRPKLIPPYLCIVLLIQASTNLTLPILFPSVGWTVCTYYGQTS